MTTNSQERSLKQWHKAILRFTLPFIWLFFLIATACTLVFLGLPCGIAAFVSWVIFGDIHADYTVVWCVFPLGIAMCYVDWLKTNDVIKP